MSVNTVNKSDGSLSKIAGKVANGELIPSVSYYQSGQKTSDTTSWSTGETGTFSINLGENMPDTNYIVVPTLNVVGVSAIVHSKTVNSFKVTVRNDREETIAQAITLYWQAFKLMTDENRALDETTIAQNTSDISDLQDDKQDKTLETPLTIGGTSQTTVEGALGGLNGVIPSDASASNKLMTRRCIRYNNASDLENAIVNLPDYSQLDFATISEITIGGVTLPQYTAWHIYRDSNGLACIGGVGYSYVDGSCYKIQGSNYPESAGLALTMQKLVTDSDLTSSVTSGSNAPITSGGVYNALNNKTSVTATPAGSDVFIAGYTIYYYPQTKRMLFNKCHIVYTQGPTMPAERPLCTITIPDGITIPENIMIPAILSVPATGEKIPSAVMLYSDGTIMTTNSEKNYQAISIYGANVFFE